ncbi:hypothetical protein GCM10010335_51170 [Streptomyces galbus]|nr:hypothetical protein GCM10010335_51170 [Streptomyces galbus]
MQALFDGGRHGGGVDHDDVSVGVEEGLEGGHGLLERPAVEVGEDRRGQGALVLRRQREVGSGHGNGSWHAQLPDSRGPVHRGDSGAPG